MSLPFALFAAALAATPAAPGDGGDDQTAAVRAAFDAAQAMQGPLDGLWRLDDRAGRVLYVFDLSDPGGPPAPLAAVPGDPGVEGAWRDPARPRAAGASGVLDSVRRDRTGLSIRFVQGPRRLAMSLRLRPGGGGRWVGVLAGDGAARPVVMSRP